ncbi:MAG: AAA family ATPase, partial [Clostridiales bacterium]|nr:AAA family ATPase [Clostridiales bacterium]
MKKLLPIGIDSFRKIRETDRYYVDKTLVIQDFIEFGDEVALVTRPRRFGKTLNMTTIREFFDITADSKAIFEGLA